MWAGGSAKCELQVLSGLAAVLLIMIGQAGISLNHDKDATHGEYLAEQRLLCLEELIHTG